MCEDLEMVSAQLVDRVVGQMPLKEALECFVAACNQRDTLYINERWFAPPSVPT